MVLISVGTGGLEGGRLTDGCLGVVDHLNHTLNPRDVRTRKHKEHQKAHTAADAAATTQHLLVAQGPNKIEGIERKRHASKGRRQVGVVVRFIPS